VVVCKAFLYFMLDRNIIGCPGIHNVNKQYANDEKYKRVRFH